jgi:hypothetical protein
MPKFQLTFPLLSGSDKQISWAESIRKTKITGFINNTAGGMSNFIDCMSLDPCTNKLLKRSIEYIINSSNASFWIDNRNNTFNQMLKTMLEKQNYINL